MEARGWHDDDTLMKDLGQALRAAEPLDDVVAAGCEAYRWFTLDEQGTNAQLRFDSYTHAARRILVFVAASMTIVLESGPGELRGRVVPRASGRMELLAPHGVVEAAIVDEHGVFVFRVRIGGLVRLRCERGSTHVMTDWFTSRR